MAETDLWPLVINILAAQNIPFDLYGEQVTARLAPWLKDRIMENAPEISDVIGGEEKVLELSYKLLQRKADLYGIASTVVMLWSGVKQFARPGSKMTEKQWEHIEDDDRLFRRMALENFLDDELAEKILSSPPIELFKFKAWSCLESSVRHLDKQRLACAMGIIRKSYPDILKQALDLRQMNLRSMFDDTDMASNVIIVASSKGFHYAPIYSIGMPHPPESASVLTVDPKVTLGIRLDNWANLFVYDPETGARACFTTNGEASKINDMVGQLVSSFIYLRAAPENLKVIFLRTAESVKMQESLICNELVKCGISRGHISGQDVLNYVGGLKESASAAFKKSLPANFFIVDNEDHCLPRPYDSASLCPNNGFSSESLAADDLKELAQNNPDMDSLVAESVSGTTAVARALLPVVKRFIFFQPSAEH
jgi:hypothetical protein